MRAKLIATPESTGIAGLQLKEIEHNGKLWHYSVSGKGPKKLLLIPSNVCGDVMGLMMANWLQENYRVISLSMEREESMENGPEGLHVVLEEEGFNSFDIWGHSMGGAHVQQFIKIYPEQVQKIIFSHSGTSLSVSETQSVQKKNGIAAKAGLKILPIVPLKPVLGKLLKGYLGLDLFDTKQHSEQFDALLKQSASALTKQDIRTMFESMDAVINRVTFSPDYYRKKPDDILIIDSEDDDILPRAALDLVPRLCPGAKHHRFQKGGHLTMISNRDEYLKLIVDFLS